MEDFRGELENAHRVDDSHDWSVHSVDYVTFKKRLSFFAQRRSRIRKLLRDARDGRLPESVFVGIMGPRTHRPPPAQPSIDYGGTGYIPFLDESATSTDISQKEDLRSLESIRRLGKRAIAKRISAAERNEIIIFLTWEMDKVAMFYNAQWQNLSNRYGLEAEGCTKALGEEILELLAFCAINIVTLRQSLIRYDAFLRTYGDSPMLQWYTKKMTKQHHHTSYRKILFHKELYALIDLYSSEMEGDTSDFVDQVQMFEYILDSTHRAEVLASTGHVVLRDTFIETLRDYFLLGYVEERLRLEPNYLTLRGTSLAGDMHMIGEWRQSRQAQGATPTPPPPTLTFQEYFGIGLNLLSGFLYCMNYYIVEPSSTKYVNALGATDEKSGLLIGMMPIAALISSIVYSIWTNHSFRIPLFCSSTLLVTGNLIYASAYKSGFVKVALAGRFMTGLGCPKVIIRRFMADTTPVTLRTGVNAGFGMAIAVGSAMGPATAILLDKIRAAPKLPWFGTIYINGMTGPGYFMAFLWTVFTLVVLVAFEEPDRGGLEEQKRMEAAAAAADTPSRRSSLGTDDGASRASISNSDGSTYELSSVLSGETHKPVLNHKTLQSLQSHPRSGISEIRAFLGLITTPVRLCLLFLFCKTFTIEALVSATSALTKNRYGWQVTQVGTLGCINGLLVIPLSILVGWMSLFRQDRVLMTALVSIGCFGMFLLIDFTDLVATPTATFNEGNLLAVYPRRYVIGYFLAFCSIQAFEGVIGSALSKVIPTALASGTFNSGLLATLVDTLGRANGDVFIFLVGGINMRQLMNLLFIPAFSVLAGCLFVIRKNYDILAV